MNDESGSPTLTLGTLDGRLNRAQTQHVMRLLQEANPRAVLAMETVVDPPSNRRSAAELFCAQSPPEVTVLLERLAAGAFNLLDVSADDLVTPLPPEVVLAAVPARRTPYDALLHKEGLITDDLPDGTRVGVLSLRSQSQIAALWPHLRPRLLYGGAVAALDAYLQQEEVDCLVIPAAVVELLGVQDLVTEIYYPEVMLPGAGQGQIALLARADDATALAVARRIDSPASHQELLGELAFRDRICSDQGCPVGVLSQVSEGSLVITGAVSSPRGNSLNHAVVRGPAEDAEALGRQLAEQLLLNPQSLIDLLEADFPDGLPAEVSTGILGEQPDPEEELAGLEEDLDDFAPPSDDY